MAIGHEVAIKPDTVFAKHDGVELLGDFYLPQGLREAPVLVGVHGGGWQVGDRKFYRHWGSYLAKHGEADQEHMDEFRDLVDQHVSREVDYQAILQVSKTVFALYGAVVANLQDGAGVGAMVGGRNVAQSMDSAA